MNNYYIQFYKEAIERYGDKHEREFIFSVIVHLIAKDGDMNDLKSLCEYYNNESEEIRNERFTTAI